MIRQCAVLLMLGVLAACASRAPASLLPGSGATITLPLQRAWYQGATVYYISTEITDPELAGRMGVNLAERLSDSIPEYPKPPEQKTVLERVYKFSRNEQDAVFASAPAPIGPQSRDLQYSPLWLVYWVSWKISPPAAVLSSERAILDAEAAGSVEVVRSHIVVNCPIVGNQAGAVLPHAVIRLRNF